MHINYLYKRKGKKRKEKKREKKNGVLSLTLHSHDFGGETKVAEVLTLQLTLQTSFDGKLLIIIN